ncbi:major facilitator superfamily transporter [Xylaria nigripes]|nr:major facilitator superfamily transporter [Xylaria nigripes]
MDSQENLFANSIWNRDDGDIPQLGELFPSWNNNHGGQMLPALEPVSRFSLDSDDDPPPKSSRMLLLREILFVATICVAHLCAQAGIGQTLPITRDIGSRFRVTNADNLSSAIAGYDMGLGAFILVASRLGAIFGHKRLFIIGLLWSAAWSLFVGASFYSTRSLLIISRTLQGVGVGLTLPSGLTLLEARCLTGIRKGVVFTLYSVMSPIGLILGALGAGIFAKLAWWPWVYWAFSITLVVLAAISCFTIPSTSRENSEESEANGIVSELDIPGMTTGITSLGLFGFAWIQAQEVGWQQLYLWIILILSVILAMLFVMIEAFYARKPLVPRSALSSDVFWILVTAGCSWSSFGIWSFYGWQFVERLRFVSPLLSTAYFVPIVIVGCIAAVSTRFIIHRIGQHETFCIAMLAMMTGGVLMVTMPARQMYWKQLFTSIVFMTWGLYTSVPASTLMVSDALDERHRDIATSLVSTVTYYGMAMGLGMAGTVKTRIIETGGGLTLYNRVKCYRATYWMSVGLAGLGFVVCLALTLVSRMRSKLRKGGLLRQTQSPCPECQGDV